MNNENILAQCSNCDTKNRIPVNRLNQGPKCGKCGFPLNVIGGRGVPVDVTDQSFDQEVISQPGAVLVDCWAPWCGPCKMVAPVLDQLAREYQGRVKIAKLNVDDNPVIASRYGIQSIPTMLIFKNGSQVDKMIGALPREQIVQHLANAL